MNLVRTAVRSSSSLFHPAGTLCPHVLHILDMVVRRAGTKFVIVVIFKTETLNSFVLA
jgi:hypothetical protein